MGKDTFMRLTGKLEEQYISYLIQTELEINDRLKELMVNKDTNLAKRIADFREALPIDSPLKNNLFFKYLSNQVSNKSSEVKNVFLGVKLADSFSIDAVTSALKELKGNIQSQELYEDIVLFSFLQSGISSGRKSITKYLPSEDYSDYTMSVMEDLKDTSLLNNPLDSYVKSDDFFRNNWKDKDLVPRLSLNMRKYKFPADFNKEFFEAIIPNGKRESTNTPIKVAISTKQAQSSYVTSLSDTASETDLKPRIVGILYKRLEYSDGSPFVYKEEKTTKEGVTYTESSHIFTPIATRGVSGIVSAEEHYVGTKGSEIIKDLKDGFQPKLEIDQSKLLKFFENKISNNLDISENSSTLQNTSIDDIDAKLDELKEKGIITRKC